MHLREPSSVSSFLGLSLLGLGCGLVGAVSGAAAAAALSHPAPVSAPVLALATTEEPVALSTSSTGSDLTPAPSTRVGFVAEIGGEHWFVLDVDASTLAPRGAPGVARRLVDDAGLFSTIAPLRARALPPALRAWRGQAVIVDGSCTDTLREFAVISQLTGDPAYAASDDETTASSHWTAASVAAHGTSFVAAKLERCTGTYGRAATAPAVVPFVEVEDPHAAIAARELMHSALADQARTAYDSQLGPAPAPEDAFDRAVQVTTHAARDPRTGTLWIAVHARAEFACGGPDANFWTLDRVDGDRLVSVARGTTDNLASVDGLVDLDGDGTPEILGAGWLEPTHAFYAADMTELASFTVPFFGCPC